MNPDRDDEPLGKLAQDDATGVQAHKIPFPLDDMPRAEQEQLATLYAAEARLRHSAEARAQRLEQVYRVGERLRADLDEAEIARRAAVAAQEVLGFRMVSVHLADEPGNPASPWRVVATAGIPPETVTMLCKDVSSSTSIQALFRPELRISRSYFIPEEVRAVIGDSALTRWRWTLETRPVQANAWHAGDTLLVPLTNRDSDQLLGFLSVNAPEHGQRPVREEVELLEIFADQAMVALRNARLLMLARTQAERDGLTGLYNHRAGHGRLEAALARACQTGTPLSLLAIDLDGFKQINDSYGHATGDLALRHIADLLARYARQDDTIARVGGDEFAVILPGASARQARAIAERLMAVSRATPLAVQGMGFVTVPLSIGAASYPEDADRVDALLAAADTRLYEVKRVIRPAAPVAHTEQQGASETGGLALLQALLEMIHEPDGYTRRHAARVVALACALASALGLSNGTLRSIRLAALLHDVGKIGVPDTVLRKEGAFNAADWDAMRRHVSLSLSLVQLVLPDQDLYRAIAHHHERWDGTGYPAGAAGMAIPLVGRILAIADAAAAMRLDRPHRTAMTRAAAIEALRAGAGSQFDPALVEPLIDVFDVAEGEG
jgi:diguanylate cyclase (GGDEF)-like protein/putative nucleotidyltransferase with HDIG domain